ncbi:MAG: amylo-alpha-1,6-glucosidase [Planctomycetota bacterium]
MSRARQAASSHDSVHPDVETTSSRPGPSTVSADPDPRSREWLLADGQGGYACGTAADLPTRRYHGLWIARPLHHARRMQVVSGLDERLLPARTLGGADPNDEDVVHLMHAHWQGMPEPSAPQADVSFARWPLPTWRFATRLGAIERSVALQPAGRNEPEDSAPEVGIRRGTESALLVRYRNTGDQPLRLMVRPLLGWCDVDHLPPANESFDGAVMARGASWGVRPDASLPPLWLTADGVASFRAEPVWYRNFHFENDRVRGYDHIGHRWSPGVLEVDLHPGADVLLSFALDEPLGEPSACFDSVALEAERKHARMVASPGSVATAGEPSLLARLESGADDFFYRDEQGRLGVLAGYPWFWEWGRDVFLALPGLTLARERADLCADVLTGCLPYLRGGLLPNVYGKGPADSRYNSCDAALWFAAAVMRFADAGHDPELVSKRLLPALRAIAMAYRAGTDLAMSVTQDGLLQAGSEQWNATWMDAETQAGPVTPRNGLPVEIQALWYALLAFLAEHEPSDGGHAADVASGKGRKSGRKTSAKKTGGEAQPAADAHSYARDRDRCGAAFLQRFWRADAKCLADRCGLDGSVDYKVRPNMLVAAALSRSPLSTAQRLGVVRAAAAQLVTPCGLRTLAPADPDYVAHYSGGLEGRDRAYHQGTVWPWLAGFYVEAEVRAVAASKRGARAKELRGWLDQLLQRELARSGIDHVSEVFDGDLPHRPGGTFAQAWNTGELLRSYAICREAEQG